jgi:hypothetical protein
MTQHHPESDSSHGLGKSRTPDMVPYAGSRATIAYPRTPSRGDGTHAPDAYKVTLSDLPSKGMRL